MPSDLSGNLSGGGVQPKSPEPCRDPVWTMTPPGFRRRIKGEVYCDDTTYVQQAAAGFLVAGAAKISAQARVAIARYVKQHWRNLIARWGAYPVVWCLAGEGTLAFYLSKTAQQDAALQKEGWSELAKYVRATDPFHHPITIHPTRSARTTVDAALLDFDMLQTGHNDRQSAASTVGAINSSLSSQPKMPVLVGEVCYEGIQEVSREEVQRYMFWACMLSGAGGHTYGANGIWQVNTREKPYRLSPYGRSWGGPPWDIAAALPGFSGQLGLRRGSPEPLLVVETRAPTRTSAAPLDDRQQLQPFAAQIPGEAVIAFFPTASFRPVEFHNLESITYKRFLFNPSDGSEQRIADVTPDANGTWRPQSTFFLSSALNLFPVFRDWVVVLERKG